MASTIKKIAVLTVAATLLTSCGSGQTAETRTIKQVTDGVEAQSNEIRLRNIKIIKILYFENGIVGNLYYSISYLFSIILSICFFLFIFLFVDPDFIYLLTFNMSIF